ncbi:MAG: hypothetical protein Q8O83_00990 [bacterium]|nr:hypothetical protein [bacterium]
MPVFIYEKDAFEKFAQVECGDDKELKKEFMRDHAEKMGGFSFQAFLKKWNKMYAKDPSIKKERKRVIDVDGSIKIRGLYGNNLYFVLYSGEMVFVGRPKETSMRTLIQLRKMGFRSMGGRAYV